MCQSRSDELGRPMYISAGGGYDAAGKRPNSVSPVSEIGAKRANASAILDIIGVMFHFSVPTVISWGLSMGLIFGGCCSNVRCPTG